MITFDEKYTFPANSVESIAVAETVNSGYKYTALTVYINNGQRFTVSYKTEKECMDAKRRLITNIEREQNQAFEKMKYELYLIKDCVKRIDKRQLWIWQQLRDLLNTPKEDNDV